MLKNYPFSLLGVLEGTIMNLNSFITLQTKGGVNSHTILISCIFVIAVVVNVKQIFLRRIPNSCG